MLKARRVVMAGAIWLVAEICAGQPAARNTAEERIRQADALQNQGSLSEARDIYQSVLTTLPADLPTHELGHVLNGLSNVSSALGDYKQAVESAERAEDVYRRLGDAEGQAYALNNRGIAEGELGQYPASQATLRKALMFSQQSGDFETQVRTLNNLGNAYYFPGHYFESLRCYQDASKIIDTHAANQWTHYWRQITRFNEATLYQRLGRYQSALEIYKDVEKSTGLSTNDRAHLFTNLGVLYRRLGDPWKALNAYRSSFVLYARHGDSVGEISTLKNIGIVYALDQGELARAQQSFELALARSRHTHSLREEMQAHLYLGETKLRQRRIRQSQEEFQTALGQAQQLGTIEEQWKALYGLGRADEILGYPEKAEAKYREGIAIIETTRAQLQLSALRTEFLGDKRDVYDALIAILLQKNDIKDAFLFIERSRARTFQDRLASNQNSPAASIPSMDELRGYLDRSTILMEFWTAGDRLALLWCTRDSCGAEQTDLSGAERDRIAAVLRAFPENLGPDWRRQVAGFARLIPGSLSLPSNLRHAVIVPDGWLSSVPFDLVPIDSSGTMLIERFDVSYLPTAALLRRAPLPSSQMHLPWMRELLAFGDPEVQATGEVALTLDGGNRVLPLPYSSAEIRSITAMLRGRSDVFLGRSNLKSKFIDVGVRGTPIVHVSTHAFADADVPENSRILFSPEASGTASYLFLREIYEMDLRDVDLATFSACDTERGKMIRGEGVQAFSRALLSAGSRSAVTSLWRVPDQPTSEFMKQFYYFALQKRQPKGEALRSAKLKFLRSQTEFENPAYWAGFVLTGDGLNTLPRFVSWPQLALACVLVVCVLVAVIWFLLRIRRRVHRINGS